MNGYAMQFGWLAGWFDGHGCIRIGKTTQETAVRLELSSCDRGVLKHVRSIVGGAIYRRPRDLREGRKQLYRWQLGGEQGVELLFNLEPLLVGKRHRAKIAAAAQSVSNRQIKSNNQGKT